MAGLIPRDFIEDLVARTDIVEVVGSRVQLKKSGREYAACCPFHGEKTPSFYVSPQKQFYHCFGCGVHGNALGFLMEYEHLDFVDAVEELARLAGVDVPHEQGDDSRARRSSPDLYAILDECAQHYRQQLKRTPDAIAYLKQRGLTGEIAAEFGIGWAPDGWDNLLTALAGDDQRRDLLERAGMLGRRDDRVYDRFRARIMFPIRDPRGRTIAFGGRIVAGDDAAKYLNSPETPVFHKGRELYGLFELRQAMRDIPRVVVVEGYMDVVALAQHGVRNAVATLGTATTPDHLTKLFRLTPEVVFCFDGDRAGRSAAWRALEQALPECKEGHQLRFLFLPDGEDPDSLVRKEGAEGFAKRVKAATPLSAFLFDSLAAQVDMATTDGRARLVELAKPLLARVPEGVFRHLLLDELAGRSGVERNVMQRLAGDGAPEMAPTRQPLRRPVQPQQRPSRVRRAIQLLVHKPALAQLAGDPERLALLESRGAPLLAELVEWLQDRPEATTGAVLEHWRDSEHAVALGKLAQVGLLTDEGLEEEFGDLLARLTAGGGRAEPERRWDELSARPLESLSDAEKAELRDLHKTLKS